MESNTTKTSNRGVYIMAGMLLLSGGFVFGLLFKQSIGNQSKVPVASLVTPDEAPGADSPWAFHDMDWKWMLTLDLPEQRTIKSMLMIHNVPGEAWSTAHETLFNKTLFPLQVTVDGKQINNRFDQPMGTYSAGKHVFMLYGRKGANFAGGKLLITFSDGSMIATDIKYSPFSRKDYPVCNGTPVTFNAGKVWIVQEGIWDSKWVRRGDSNVFDASTVMRGSNASTFAYEITMEPVDDYYVKFYRKDTAGYYHGILSCDKKSIIKGVGDWFVGGDRWNAIIYDQIPDTTQMPDTHGETLPVPGNTTY